jgi:hypothetical protein
LALVQSVSHKLHAAEILVKGLEGAELSQVVEGKGKINSANVSQLGYAI